MIDLQMIQLLVGAWLIYLALRFVIFRKLLQIPPPKEKWPTAAARFAVHIAAGLAIAAGMLAITLLPGLVTGNITIQPGAPDAASAASVQVPGNLYVMVAQSALWEELAFRGVIMLIFAGIPALIVRLVAGAKVLRAPGFQLFLWLNAAAISSLVFSLAHSDNPSANGLGALNIFLVGLMLSLLFLRTGGLTAPYAFHFAWNSLLEVVNLPVSGYDFASSWHPFSLSAQGSPLLTGGSFGPEASLPLTVLLIAVDIVLVRLLTSPKKLSEQAVQAEESAPQAAEKPPTDSAS